MNIVTEKQQFTPEWKGSPIKTVSPDEIIKVSINSGSDSDRRKIDNKSQQNNTQHARASNWSNLVASAIRPDQENSQSSFLKSKKLEYHSVESNTAVNIQDDMYLMFSPDQSFEVDANRMDDGLESENDNNNTSVENENSLDKDTMTNTLANASSLDLHSNIKGYSLNSIHHTNLESHYNKEENTDREPYDREAFIRSHVEFLQRMRDIHFDSSNSIGVNSSADRLLKSIHKIFPSVDKTKIELSEITQMNSKRLQELFTTKVSYLSYLLSYFEGIILFIYHLFTDLAQRVDRSTNN